MNKKLFLNSLSHCKIRPLQRGAVLIYALATVLIISLLVLAIGRLVASHTGVAESSRSYSKAIFIAESAANWQLNRMSRSLRKGDGRNIAGRIPYDQINNASDTDELTIDGLSGKAQVWVTGLANINAPWTPPSDFVLYAVGKDTSLGTDANRMVARGISFTGRGTGLSEPYALFANSTLTFKSDGSDSVTLKRGYIGSNGLVQKTGGTPPTKGTQFAGCRLGGNANISPTPVQGSGWTKDWDMPRLPDTVKWPTIDAIIDSIWPGRQPQDFKNSQNANGNQIYYLDATGTLTHFQVPIKDKEKDKEFGPATQLTDTEFKLAAKYTPSWSNKPLRMIILKADVSTANANVFYFTDIQMGDDDFLVLDLANADSPSQFSNSLRILVDNDNLNTNLHVTNLAYYQADDKTNHVRTPTPSFIWWNNTNQPIEFQPEYSSIKDKKNKPHTRLWEDTSQKFYYGLIPEVKGLVYGITTRSGQKAGDVIVLGKSSFNTFTDSIVAPNITLKGRVTVSQPATGVEQFADSLRYVLYYRIFKGYFEINPNSPKEGRKDIYGYGTLYQN